MTKEQAKSEYAQHISDASHCFRRALRMEKLGYTHAANANWVDGIYNNMQCMRDNLQTALALY